MERVRWSPDGKALLVSGSDNKGRGGLYIIDPRTSEVKPLVSESGAPFAGFEAVWPNGGGVVYYVRGGEVRSREIASGRETTVYRGEQVRHLAASPDGKLLAVGSGGRIVFVPAAGGEPRSIAFEGLTELEWGRTLIAGKGAELWRIPIDGDAPEKLDSPGNRNGGFSLHPDGERLALTAGDQKSEVWALPLR